LRMSWTFKILCGHISLPVGIWHALRLIHQLEVPKDRYEFQMLLGVDEELRGVLVGAGHKLRVYVPFGEDW
jgi:proline dehydrogenase